MNALRQHQNDFAGLEPQGAEDQTRCQACGAPAGRHQCPVLKREAGHLPEEQPSCSSCGDVPGGCPSCDGRHHRAVALAGKAPRHSRLHRSRPRGARR